MKKVILYTAMLFLLSGIAFSYFETGNTLFSNLSKGTKGDTKDFGDYANACGYVIGIYDAYIGILFSDSFGVSKGQIVDIAKKYLREHPESRHKPATILLVEAF